MGTIPGVGFKTNVKDEEFAEKIIQTVAEEFEEIEYDKQQYALSVDGFNRCINCTILEGEYDEYIGLNNDGLVFTYKPLDWPNWREYSEKGNLMEDIRLFIDSEYEYVSVEDVHPTIPTT